MTESAEPSSPDPDKRIGSIIAGKYRIEKLLGKGGMGAVYLVTHLGIERKFALKLLHPEMPGKTEATARFELEAQAAGRIGHPSIIDVFDLGHDEHGAPYMVMELLAGESLAERVARGPLPIGEATGIMIEVLRALEAAHAADIIHRDIKPANIFLVEKPDGTRGVKVLDFGIAKFSSSDATLTRTGAVMGSPLYMAPEQVTAERDIDARVDVWAVGATLYELLVGVAAHRAPSHAALIVRIVTMPVPSMCLRRAEIDAQLDALVLRALSIDPAARFASAADMRRALERHETSSATSMPAPGSARAPARSRAALLGVAALALVAGAALAIRWGRAADADKEPPRLDSGPTASEILLEDPPAQTASAPRPRPSAAVSAPPPAPSASAIAPRIVPSIAPPRAGRDAAAAEVRTLCPTGQRETRGHCCQIGLVWEEGACARPLGTDVPF